MDTSDNEFMFDELPDELLNFGKPEDSESAGASDQLEDVSDEDDIEAVFEPADLKELTERAVNFMNDATDPVRLKRGPDESFELFTTKGEAVSFLANEQSSFPFTHQILDFLETNYFPVIKNPQRKKSPKETLKIPQIKKSHEKDCLSAEEDTSSQQSAETQHKKDCSSAEEDTSSQQSAETQHEKDWSSDEEDTSSQQSAETHHEEDCSSDEEDISMLKNLCEDKHITTSEWFSYKPESVYIIPGGPEILFQLQHNRGKQFLAGFCIPEENEDTNNKLEQIGEFLNQTCAEGGNCMYDRLVCSAPSGPGPIALPASLLRTILLMPLVAGGNDSYLETLIDACYDVLVNTEKETQQCKTRRLQCNIKFDSVPFQCRCMACILVDACRRNISESGADDYSIIGLEDLAVLREPYLTNIVPNLGLPERQVCFQYEFVNKWFKRFRYTPDGFIIQLDSDEIYDV